jgi:hypothetical protein
MHRAPNRLSLGSSGAHGRLSVRLATHQSTALTLLWTTVGHPRPPRAPPPTPRAILLPGALPSRRWPHRPRDVDQAIDRGSGPGRTAAGEGGHTLPAYRQWRRPQCLIGLGVVTAESCCGDHVPRARAPTASPPTERAPRRDALGGQRDDPETCTVWQAAIGRCDVSPRGTPDPGNATNDRGPRFRLVSLHMPRTGTGTGAQNVENPTRPARFSTACGAGAPSVENRTAADRFSTPRGCAAWRVGGDAEGPPHTTTQARPARVGTFASVAARHRRVSRSPRKPPTVGRSRRR